MHSGGTLVRMAGSATTVRFADEIDAEIRKFAASMGISFTAALSVLAVEALTARGLHEAAEAKR